VKGTWLGEFLRVPWDDKAFQVWRHVVIAPQASNYVERQHGSLENPPAPFVKVGNDTVGMTHKKMDSRLNMSGIYDKGREIPAKGAQEMTKKGRILWNVMMRKTPLPTRRSHWA
jgi:hypothetical protein